MKSIKNIIKPKWVIVVFVLLHFSVSAQTSEIETLEKEIQQLAGEEYYSKINDLAKLYLDVDVSVTLELIAKNNTSPEIKQFPEKYARAIYLKGLALTISRDYDQAQTSFKESINIAKTLKDKNLLAQNYVGSATAYTKKGEYEKAEKLYESGIKILKEDSNNKALPDAYFRFGMHKFFVGDYKTSLKLYEQSLNIYKNSEDKKGMSDVLYWIGVLYDSSNDDEKAMTYYFDSRVIKEEIQDIRGLSHSNLSLGTLHWKADNYKQAMYYYNQSLEGYRNLGDKSSEARVYNNMGLVYEDRKKLDSALIYHRKSLKIHSDINSVIGLIRSYSNMGEAYLLKKDYDKSISNFLKAKSYSIASEKQTSLAYINDKLAEVYLNTNKLDSASIYLNKSLKHSLKNDEYSSLESIYFNFSKLEKRRGDFEKALKYHELHKEVADSLIQTEKNKELAEIQAKYDTEKKENEIIKLQQQNLKSESWRNIFALGTLGMLLIAAFIYMFYRYRQLNSQKLIEANTLQTKQLKEINKMKSKFLANISHEFRTPLTLIIGPAKELLTNTKEEETRQQLNWIHKNSQKLLKLINQLLELSKLEAGKEKLKTSQHDIVSFSRHIFNLFESLAKQKHLKTSFKSEKEQIYVYFDSEKLEQVITNLLSNAFKFTDKGEVSVALNEVTIKNIDYCKITIQDSGKGIHEQQLPYVFDRFYQADQDGEDSYEGTGIGLSLSKELIELHSGKIEAESELNKGTSFHLLIPLGKGHLKEEQIIPSLDYTFSNEIPQETNSTENDTEGVHEDTQPLVLIVDDNKDIVDYIQVSLNGKYRFLKAFDGNQGLEFSENELPDLIISDVMMPGLNGLQLCEKVKTNVKTDHIPVILLTAKAGENDKIDGLEAKADEYLQKPFNKKELQVRAHNLIENRKRLRKRFTNKVIFKPSEVAENSQEELFLNNLKEIVENNHTDSQFDVKSFCELIHMSKSQLNRKMKAVFNKSPNQFIRSYRLEKAKYLIAQDRGFSLSEIAYEVGFASPAYFSKCFNDEFGYAPSELKS